jgi:hypothetical protein
MRDPLIAGPVVGLFVESIIELHIYSKNCYS